MHDLIAELDRTGRAVADADLGGAPAHVVELRRRLHAPVAEVWDACTDAERVGRWFLPLSGDLRPGGNFQLEGNASGKITICTPPHRLQLTWQFGDAEPSLVSLELTPAGDDTELVLRHTVPDDEHAAALDVSLAETLETLERLIDQQLLDVAGEDPPSQVRFQFHDLLADFARERLAAEETAAGRRAGLERAFGACLALTDALVGQISSSVPTTSARARRSWLPECVPPTVDQPSAFAWLAAEPAALVEMVERAARTPGLAAWELAVNIGCVFEQSMRWADWRAALEAGVRAARRDGDIHGQAVSLRAWGHYHNERGEHAEAARCLEAALEQLGELDDRRELAAALVGLADARWSQGSPAAAIPLLERALVVLRALDETGREAWALYMLALANTSLGRLREAQRQQRESIERYARLGDLRREAFASHGMGTALLEASRPEEAAWWYERAQALGREAGDETIGTLRYGLGYALRDQGRFEDALRELHAAYAISSERDYKRGIVYALHGLGTVAHRTGGLDEAAVSLQRALALAREMGDKRSTARSLRVLGEVRLDQRRVQKRSRSFAPRLRSRMRASSGGSRRTRARSWPELWLRQGPTRKPAVSRSARN